MEQQPEYDDDTRVDIEWALFAIVTLLERADVALLVGMAQLLYNRKVTR